MTQPDGLVPGNVFGPISELAARTQEEWEEQLRGSATAGLEVFRDSLFGSLPADLQEGIEFTRALLMAIVRRILGLPGQVWDSVEDALDALGASGIVETIDKLRAALDGIPWQSGDPGAILRAILAAGVQLVRGVIPQWMLPPIHVGRLTSDLPPLVADGGFDLVPPSGGVPGGWFHDGAKGRSGLGSSWVVGDGSYQDLAAPPVAVAEGQKYRIGAFPACESATGGVGCVQLQVLEFGAGDVPVNTHVVASWTPSGTQGFGAEIFGEYTVPAGVELVSVTLAVTEGFTGGLVGFDDVSGPSTGLIEQSWVQDLLGDLSSLFNWIGSLIDNLLAALGITPTGGLMDRIFDLSDELEWLKARGEDIGDLISDLLTNPASVLGPLPQSLISGLSSALSSLGGQITSGIGDVVSNIFNGWFGSGSTGDVAEIAYTIEAIKDAVLSGYTVQTITSTQVWDKPEGLTELAVICVGGGEHGEAGDSGGTNGVLYSGGAGGRGGGFIAAQLSPEDVASSVTCTIGVNGGATSFGSYVSIASGQVGGIASMFGYTATSSTPGDGGKGGDARLVANLSTDGGPGTASAVGGAGAGGTAGAGGGTSQPGGAGGNVSAAAATKCGGGGGGGGGGRYGTTIGQTVNGGPGGAGGYPGGGAGGGGAAAMGTGTRNPGLGGAGGAGVLWIFSK